jgi:hypothetical protein
VSDGKALSGEEINNLIAIQEISKLLAGQFTGKVVLHCAGGEIKRYVVEQTRIPGQEAA